MSAEITRSGSGDAATQLDRSPPDGRAAPSIDYRSSGRKVQSRTAKAREGLRSDEVSVRVRPAVAVELPRLADFLDLVEVHVPDDQLLVVGAAQVADELAPRIDEVALAVEVVVAVVLLDADAVDRPDEVA